MDAIPIISIHSHRGGSGKTFLSANLAHVLTAKYQKRVLLIDFDVIGGNLSIIIGKKTDFYFNDYVKGNIRNFEQLLTPLAENLSLIAAHPENELLYLDKKIWINVFRRLLLDLEDITTTQKFDVVIFDNHPSIIHPSVAAMALCTDIFWVLRANTENINTFVDLITTTELKRILKEKNTSVILNMILPQYEEFFHTKMTELHKYFPVLGKIRFYDKLFSGIATETLITQKEPDSLVSQDILQLTEEFLQKKEK